jgi:hypothetical protein
MVPSSSIAIAADDERLACGGFSLGETVSLGNFEFIADYFGRLSEEGATFMGSTCSGASTPWRAMIEDSTEEFLTASIREGSFGLPHFVLRPKRKNYRGNFVGQITKP